MNGTITRLSCRYRCYNGRAKGEVQRRRLEAVLREYVPKALGQALDQILGDDPTVYVLRRVTARTTLRIQPNASDGELGRRWGESLAGAVLRTLAAGADAEMVQFPNRASYVASFLADLMHGVAWERWFYGPFARLRGATVADVVQDLLDDRELIGPVLAALHSGGTLWNMLNRLDNQQQLRLWQRAGDRAAALDPATYRPFVAAALDLVSMLHLWANAPPAGAALLDRFVQTAPAPPDWRDRRGLALVLLAVLRLLVAEGLVRPAAAIGPPAALDDALAKFDWLDIKLLRDELPGLFATPALPTHDLPVRGPTAGPTPRQRELLADLAAALGMLALDRGALAAPASALAWYAALMAHAPHWSGDVLATGTIHMMLQAAATAYQATLDGRHENVGRPHEPWPATPNSVDLSAQASLQTPPNMTAHRLAERMRARVRELGPDALALVAALTGIGWGTGRPALSGAVRGASGMSAPAVVLPAATAIDTRCAGVFLMVRTVLDIRLPAAVAGRHGALGDYSAPFAALLAALMLRLAGSDALQSEVFDPGIATLAGLEMSPSLPALHDALAALHPEWLPQLQGEIMRVLAGQRLMRGDELHIHSLTMPDGTHALVAGAEIQDLWLFSHSSEVPTLPAELITHWAAQLHEACGRVPLIVADAALHDTAGSLVDQVRFIAAESTDDRAQTHRRSREVLEATLSAFHAGQLGLASTDLMVGLLANVLVRVWSRWLRHQFAQSSSAYLLEQCIRRPGRIMIEAAQVTALLEDRPLDVVIEIAGYLADIEQVPWLRRRLRFGRVSQPY